VSPLWRHAPLLSLRFPALFGAIGLAALLLALALASGPLFVSSAASSALSDELEDATRFGAGATVVYDSFSSRLHPEEADNDAAIMRLDAELSPELEGVPHLDAPVLTVLGPAVTPGTEPGPSTQRQLRLLAKTDAVAHIKKLAGQDGDGYWIADEAAESMQLVPGDSLYIEFESGAVRQIRIDGIYRALWKEPRTPFWRSLSHFIYEQNPDAGPPPTFLIADQEAVVGLEPGGRGHGGRGQFQLRWEWPLSSTEFTLDEAEALAGRLSAFQEHTEGLATRLEGCPACQPFPPPEVSYSSLLPIAIAAARERVSTLRGPADLLTAAGALVAVAVLGGAAAFAMARRRVEARVLFARGAAPGEFGARAGVEAVLPVLAGAAAGLLLAVGLTVLVGPGAVAQSAFLTAVWATALVVPAAAALIGLMSAVLFILGSERRSQGSLRHVFVPWEIPVLAAAAVFLYLLQTRGAFGDVEGADEVGRPSLAILLFPLFFIAGFAGLAARGLRRTFARLRGVGRFPPAAFLAAHRLASAGPLAALLAASTAVCLGTFVYAQAVARSLEETVEAKSLLFVGSDVSGRTDYDRQIDNDFPLPTTKVTKLVEHSRLGDVNVDVMVIDPETFSAAAYFDKSWSNESLSELVRRVQMPSSRLPVIVTGREPDARALTVRSVELPVEVVATVTAFPGMTRRRPLVVADRDRFERAVDDVGASNPLASLGAETYVWVKGQTRPTVSVLEASQLRPFPIFTAEQVRENPQIRSVTQTFSYLRALGLAAGLLALAGAVLYLQARHRNRVISNALARRMGLSARSHRFALALELGTLLVFSFAVGAVLAMVAARLVVVELDAPAPLPGGPLFRTPWGLIVAAFAALLVATAFGALLADRRARRAKVAEVIRAAE
jgi:putative ABC transport system permease protein